jgi:hypothetical protein
VLFPDVSEDEFALETSRAHFMGPLWERIILELDLVILNDNENALNGIFR